MPLDKSSYIILRQCMNLKKNESCLVVTDSKLRHIGNILYKKSLKITNKSKIILTTIPQAHGTEPPKRIADEMLKYDVILLATTKSLSHTTARKTASLKGIRIASMPGITTGMMERALDINFNRIKNLNNRLTGKLKNKNKARIITKKGTDIEFELKGRKWIGDDGIYTKKGSFGNLPAGEIFIAPLEHKASGKIIVDASVGGIGKVDKDIEITVENGFIENVNGGKVANAFKKMLKSKLYKNVAELGIGTNYKAKITGNVLEDEKVYGTCHIAFGNSRHFGGKVDVPFHVDVVIRKPTIHADDRIIIKNGKIA
ncbi:aminopeptidase [Candidatus Woesearchaeota archaeon]|nr:aminopeptidase [Candidatus Woesearchaeota archaeon]